MSAVHLTKNHQTQQPATFGQKISTDTTEQKPQPTTATHVDQFTQKTDKQSPPTSVKSNLEHQSKKPPHSAQSKLPKASITKMAQAGILLKSMAIATDLMLDATLKKEPTVFTLKGLSLSAVDGAMYGAVLGWIYNRIR
jgi:hypothetical protein